MNDILVKIANNEVPLVNERWNRIYISGPMTGLPNYNFEAFNEASKKLTELGWVVSNPADHGLVEGANREDYLRYDAAQLVSCSTVFLLPGWENSDGARWEVSIAEKLKMVSTSRYISPNHVAITNSICNCVRKRLEANKIEEMLKAVRPADCNARDIDYLKLWTK